MKIEDKIVIETMYNLNSEISKERLLSLIGKDSDSFFQYFTMYKHLFHYTTVFGFF